VRPVVPFHLSKDLNMIARFIVPRQDPSLPRFGLRKRTAEEKQKEMKESASGLKSLLQQYTLGTSPQRLAFYDKAQVRGLIHSEAMGER
jgi:hypothetical protein